MHLHDRYLKGHPEDDIGSTTNGQRDLAYQFVADGWVVDADDVHKFIANHPDYGMEEMVMEYLAKLGHLIPPVPVRPARSRKQCKATRAVDRDHAINHRLRAFYGRKPQQPDASPPEVTLDSLRPCVLAIMSAGSCDGKKDRRFFVRYLVPVLQLTHLLPSTVGESFTVAD